MPFLLKEGSLYTNQLDVSRTKILGISTLKGRKLIDWSKTLESLLGEQMTAEAQASILIVDDQPENLSALEALLGPSGHEIVKAHSGKEALKHLLTKQFALILLDIQMPDIDGFETAELIRQREQTKHTPIIFLTAMYTEDVHEAEAYTLGAVDFITKPFPPHVLVSKVNFFVDLFQKNQRIQLQANLIREIEKRRLAETKERLEGEKRRMEEDLIRKEREKEILQARSSQLQKADRLKDEFLANMSHEIRTPMNAVIGFTELLLRTELDQEQFEFAERIRESAQGLLTLINDILDLSKIAAGKMDLETAEFELGPIVEGATNILAEAAAQKKLGLMTFVDPRLPAIVHGDGGRLRQVLLNLIGNAIKFTESGDIVVSAKLAEKQDERPDYTTLLFSVTDTGIGLRADEVERLFRPFTQADGSTTRRFGGTGLGLSISKRLVELMDGEIGVNSEFGKGSTFWFRVPLRVASAPVKRVFPVSDKLKTNVLVVDSNDSGRDILQAYIRSWNMRCDAARNYDEAMAMMKDKAAAGSPYALVISEMTLENHDAFQLLESMRKDADLVGSRVILCTAGDKTGLGERAVSKGFSAYLTKPLEQSRLYDCIANVMSGAWERLTESTDNNGGGGTPTRHLPEAPTVLLAEDNPVNQQLTVLQLQKLGYNCIAVANGKEAVKALEKTAYSLVLMDCQMPEMDGLEATKAIRKAEALMGTHVPIVGLTAHAMGGDREKCIAAGMDDYLSKPASLEKIRATLTKWLGAEEDFAMKNASSDKEKKSE